MGTVRILNTHQTKPYIFSYGGQTWVFQPKVGEWKLGQRVAEVRQLENKEKVEAIFESKEVDGVSTMVPSKKLPDGWADGTTISKTVMDVPVKLGEKKMRNFHDIPEEMAKFLFNGKNQAYHKGNLKRAKSLEEELDAEAVALEEKRKADKERDQLEIMRLQEELTKLDKDLAKKNALLSSGPPAPGPPHK